MARIKFGSIITEASGSVGSATFQKSLYGNTLRSRPRNTRTGTAAQLVARSIMMQCQYAWRNLTNADRRQWNQFVAFSGQSINRDRGILTTGHSLFLKWNFLRLLNDLGIVSTIVYQSAPAWPHFTSLGVTETNTFFFVSDNLTALSISAIIHVSSPRQVSQSFSTKGLRFLPSIQIQPTYIFFTNQMAIIFGANPVAGNSYHYRVQFFSIVSPIISSIQKGVFIAQQL